MVVGVVVVSKPFTTSLKITFYICHPLNHEQLILLPTYQQSRGQLETSEFSANLLRGSLSVPSPLFLLPTSLKPKPSTCALVPPAWTLPYQSSSSSEAFRPFLSTFQDSPLTQKCFYISPLNKSSPNTHTHTPINAAFSSFLLSQASREHCPRTVSPSLPPAHSSPTRI